MSVKAMSLVWDLECHKKYGECEKEFRTTHKFVLLAYADHADHHGKNIYPAAATVAKKTGLEERSVRRLTDELEEMGLLIEDGYGPRGTNKFRMPIGDGGWQGVTPDTESGDNGDKSLGDSASPDSASPDSVSPEFKEPEPEYFNISNKHKDVWEDMKRTLSDEMPRASFDTWVRDTKAVHFENNTLWVATRNDYARNWLTERLKLKVQKDLGIFVNFMTVHAEGE